MPGIDALAALSGLTGPTGPGRPSDPTAPPDAAAAVRAAKDFESVLLYKVMQSMRDTVGESGLLDDDCGRQMQDMFWYYLAQGVADQGGLGLWKDVYRQLAARQAGAAGAEQAGQAGLELLK